MFQEWEVSPEKARLSSNAIDAGYKLRPTEEELKEMGPEFNELWNRYFKDKPDKPVMFGSIVAGAYADHSLLPPGNYITMYVPSCADISHPLIAIAIGSSTWSTLLLVAR